MQNPISSTPAWRLAGASLLVLALAACNSRDEAAPAADAPAAAAPAAGEAPAASGPAAAFMPAEMDMKAKMAAATGSTTEHTWAAKMIAHHQGGIDMSKALLAQSPEGPMHDMAQKAIDDQTKERSELEAWIKGHEVGGATGANPFAGMEQSMSQKMMAASGADADQTWARKMIEHHQGAIDMAKRVLQDAKDADIRNMAEKIIDKQGKEIETLRAKLNG